MTTSDHLDEIPLNLSVNSVSSSCAHNLIDDQNQLNGPRSNANLCPINWQSTTATNSTVNNSSTTRLEQNIRKSNINLAQLFESIWAPQNSPMVLNSSSATNFSFCDANNNQAAPVTKPPIKRDSFGRFASTSNDRPVSSSSTQRPPARYQFIDEPQTNYASAYLRKLDQQTGKSIGPAETVVCSRSIQEFSQAQVSKIESGLEQSHADFAQLTNRIENALKEYPREGRIPMTMSILPDTEALAVTQSLHSIAQQLDSTLRQLEQIKQFVVTKPATEVPSQPVPSLPVLSSRAYRALYGSRTNLIPGVDCFICPYPKCRMVLTTKQKFDYHRRAHLGIKPYQCKWENCKHSCAQKSNLTKHIRRRHFRLPDTFKEQAAKNISDDRDAKQFVKVDQELLDKALLNCGQESQESNENSAAD